MSKVVSAKDVLDFWFKELSQAQWFAKDDALDKTISQRFQATLSAAAQCELFDWRETTAGRLAEIIVLDQFSRNIYRDRPEAFANDALALALAQETVRLGLDSELTRTQKAFLYMPYMHSKSLPIHDVALRLYDQPGLEYNLEFEIKHRDIIVRFGRYPHRNELLGRASTDAEIAFLKQPGSSF
ncbi:DUF924 family protein [Aliidiomarina haloalkalitolerans]|uniref:DUF924 domain-containing protein n=1 Tax=Aliidiomarina haloalkalitolerans TaxID=859059 RepID=A0A432VYT0_9GAMM|nr:DUF924 family protein [Aliidiomarina haloalkalitolerans]RUO21818.1 DUF924 domain-containing protein [Aliidiomarina haloalkalitolerans]